MRIVENLRKFNEIVYIDSQYVTNYTVKLPLITHFTLALFHTLYIFTPTIHFGLKRFCQVFLVSLIPSETALQKDEKHPLLN